MRRVGVSELACRHTFAQIMGNMFSSGLTGWGIRLAAIGPTAGGSFLRANTDTYSSRIWDIVASTEFPAWPPTTVTEFTHSGSSVTFGTNRAETIYKFQWHGVWSPSTLPRGFLLYVPSASGDSVPWYPLVTSAFTFTPATTVDMWEANLALRSSSP